MKSTIAAIAITLALAGFTGCGPSAADRKAKADAADAFAAAVAAEGQHRLDGENDLLTLSTVKLTQGEEAAHTMDICMGIDGYKMTTDDGGRWVDDSSYTKLSNRRKAECDAIVEMQNRIDSARNAQEKAEEKRKDAAYDRAHSPEGLKAQARRDAAARQRAAACKADVAKDAFTKSPNCEY